MGLKTNFCLSESGRFTQVYCTYIANYFSRYGRSWLGDVLRSAVLVTRYGISFRASRSSMLRL